MDSGFQPLGNPSQWGWLSELQLHKPLSTFPWKLVFLVGSKVNGPQRPSFLHALARSVLSTLMKILQSGYFSAQLGNSAMARFVFFAR